MNKIIKSDLKLIKILKCDDQRLTPKHISHCKIMCRLLYENYLAGEKWKCRVTVDEVWRYLFDCDIKRLIRYRKRE